MSDDPEQRVNGVGILLVFQPKGKDFFLQPIDLTENLQAPVHFKRTLPTTANLVFQKIVDVQANSK